MDKAIHHESYNEGNKDALKAVLGLIDLIKSDPKAACNVTIVSNILNPPEQKMQNLSYRVGYLDRMALERNKINRLIKDKNGRLQNEVT